MARVWSTDSALRSLNFSTLHWLWPLAMVLVTRRVKDDAHEWAKQLAKTIQLCRRLLHFFRVYYQCNLQLTQTITTH